MDTAARSVATCTSCGSTEVHATPVRSAFWHEGRLVVVEGIPALACASCGEQYYDDATVIRLDLLRGDGFPAERASGELRVPVFSLEERATARESP